MVIVMATRKKSEMPKTTKKAVSTPWLKFEASENIIFIFIIHKNQNKTKVYSFIYQKIIGIYAFSKVLKMKWLCYRKYYYLAQIFQISSTNERSSIYYVLFLFSFIYHFFSTHSLLEGTKFCSLQTFHSVTYWNYNIKIVVISFVLFAICGSCSEIPNNWIFF